jgi:hypothetical protein
LLPNFKPLFQNYDRKISQDSPGIIEVASNNWKDDYLTKLAEYVRVASRWRSLSQRREDLGVFEYIIVDYAAFGGCG